jgi:hypothetical protein
MKRSKTVQRTGAGRFAQTQIGRRWQLTPVADLMRYLKSANPLKSLPVKIPCLVLAMLLVSCAANHPVVSQTPTSVQQAAYVVVTNAISRGDWDVLRKLTTPGMRANEYVTMWENSERINHPVRVGKLLSVGKSSSYYLDGKPCTTFSFALEDKDGSPNPHLLQILMREKHGRAEILDFWNFGW